MDDIANSPQDSARAYIKRVLQTLSISPTALAKKAGLASTTVTRALASDHQFALSMTTINKIEKATGIQFRGSAAPAAMPVEPVVKPLEWDQTTGTTQAAETIIGWYHVDRRQAPERDPIWYWKRSGGLLKPCLTETEAKAAAQADYEARIRSALATPPAPAGADVERVAEVIWESHELRPWSDADKIDRGFHLKSAQDVLTFLATPGDGWPSEAKFKFGDLVRKKSGSWWEGRVVGWYRTDQTALGYAVQLDRDFGPVQIYPEAALEAME